MKRSLLLTTLLAVFGAPAMATTFIAEYVSPLAASGAGRPSSASAPAAAGPAPGLYVQVLDGTIVVTNPAGSLNFAAGQFGYVTSTRPPVLLPASPGLQFTPPPAFNFTAPGTIVTGAPKSNTVECIVR